MTNVGSANKDAYDFDLDLQIKDAESITASAAALVAASAQVLDLGDAKMAGTVVINITALDFTTADENYRIEAQFSNSATFADTSSAKGCLRLGDALNGSHDQVALGHYEFPVTNIGDNGTVLRYMRLYHVLAGTTPIIDYTAHLALPPVL